MRVVFWCLAITFILGCSKEKPRALSTSERKEVSQRYADTVRLLTPLVDSLCKVNRDQLVRQLTDSLYADRVADLERQRQRFEQ